jgi:hypothetical protein
VQRSGVRIALDAFEAQVEGSLRRALSFSGMPFRACVERPARSVSEHIGSCTGKIH